MNRLFFIVILLLLASCQSNQDDSYSSFISDKDVQHTLQLTPNTDIILPDWFNLFHDKDLNTLLTHIDYHNLTIQQAKERLIQSRIQFNIQTTQNLPLFDASGEYNYNKTHRQNSYATDIDLFKIGFDASWEIDLWGKRKYLSDQYFELVKKAQYTLLNVQATISAEIISNYISLREAQELRRIATINLQLQKEIQQIVKDKYQAGIADELALAQAQFTIEQTKAIIPPLEANIESYKNSIALLLGVLPQDLPVNLDKYKENIVRRTFKYSVKDLYNLPLDVIRTRPDIMASEAAIKSQDAEINLAITNLYPSINLSASFGYIAPKINSLISSQHQNYGYTPGITTPIWHWKQLINNVKLQKHIKEEYLLNYNEALLTALMELKNNITAVKIAYETNSYQKSAQTKMKTIMDLSRKKYENGLIEFTDIATAEQNLLSSQTNVIKSNAEILQAITAFYKSTGGGFNFRNK